MASISQATFKQYDVAWKKWWYFCVKNSFNIFENCIENILKFLTEMYEEKASYGTLNSYRAALSFLISPNIGENPNIKRFMNGIYHLRPLKPKYNFTWDPAIVLSYLKTLYPNETINLKLLTIKLVTLMALATGHRAQTISLINIDNIILSSEGVTIKIPDRIKTSRKGALKPLLVLPFFPSCKQICVANTLKVYLERTKLHRNANKNLFLTFKKPFRKATVSSISRWVKEALTASGIDISVFSSHSTRHASTSAAFNKGVNIDVIRATAGWSEKSQVFARFYNRPIIENKDIFAISVLNSLN